MVWQQIGKTLKANSLSFALIILISSSSLADNLKKIKVKVGKTTITVEVANTEKSRERGLMERSKLDKNCGMLFVFPDESKRYFWMKNTYIPLSIGFFDKDSRLVEVQEMKPMGSPMEKDIPRYQSHLPAKFALEMERGWFKKNKIKLKDKLQFIDPLLADKKPYIKKKHETKVQ